MCFLFNSFVWSKRYAFFLFFMFLLYKGITKIKTHYQTMEMYRNRLSKLTGKIFDKCFKSSNFFSYINQNYEIHKLDLRSDCPIFRFKGSPSQPPVRWRYRILPHQASIRSTVCFHFRWNDQNSRMQHTHRKLLIPQRGPSGRRTQGRQLGVNCQILPTRPWLKAHRLIQWCWLIRWNWARA